MPMIALVSAALADRVIWTSDPTPTQEAEALRLAPDAVALPLERFGAEDPPTPTPDAAMAVVAAQLDAAPALYREFDGELLIMGRLQKALADVHEVRSPDELRLVVRAMLVQGYAVRRYYQDELPNDPGAAPYRSVGGVPAAWEWAVARGAGSTFPLDDIPQPAERVAFDGVRAAILASPAASILVHPRPVGTAVEVDGVVVPGDVPTVVLPGRHFVRVVSGGETVAWVNPTLAPGQTFVHPVPIGPAERRLLVSSAAAGHAVPAALRAMLGGEPTWLAVPGKTTTFYRLDRGIYEAPPRGGALPRFALTAAIGAGWVSTGDFFRLNRADGAPRTVETVNAASPSASIGGGVSVGPFAAGLGADLQYAVGDWHAVPSGDASTSMFTWVYADLGTRWVRLSAGPLFPWHIGLGGHVRVPLWRGLGLAGGGAWGLPLRMTRPDGSNFEPYESWSAWGGIGFTTP